MKEPKHQLLHHRYHTESDTVARNVSYANSMSHIQVCVRHRCVYKVNRMTETCSHTDTTQRDTADTECK
jgi:hypothetical protein